MDEMLRKFPMMIARLPLTFREWLRCATAKSSIEVL